jgi:hypothetical protein
MNVTELKEIIRNLISNEYSIEIPYNRISSIDGLKEYNRIIRLQVQDLTGIYLWENADNNEILYIGMAGKINQQGVLGNHTVKMRLQASRGKNPETGRDVQSNEFILNLMAIENCNQMNIHVIHLQNGQIPGYAEAVLVNAFYQRNRLLPRYNNAF